jgi:hypothetical protein
MIGKKSVWGGVCIMSALAMLCLLGAWLVVSRVYVASAAVPTGVVVGGPQCDPDWQIVSSPNALTSNNYLYGVDALSADDVWAVGGYQNGTQLRTLAVHWDGSRWSKLTTPNPGSDGINLLQGVAAVADDDVWAVGYKSAAGLYKTLILHWNGSTWSEVASPNLWISHNYLAGVSAVSASDVWAVGNYTSAGINRTLALHWNGSTWSSVAIANMGTSNNYLTGVTAVAANNVWAVGSYESGGVRKTLTIRWNGTSWAVVSSPNQGTANNLLQAVSAVSASDVWAVGNYYSSPAYRTLAMHWNGTAWSVVASSNLNSADNYLYGVAGVSATDGWAVGYYEDGTAYRTMMLRYSGGSWVPASSPNVGTNDNELFAVSAVSASDAWAVGQYTDDGLDGLLRALSLHWTGSAWSVVPSANGERAANRLNSVAAVSANDVWAVGMTTSVSTSKSLVEHWDGSAWSIVPSPNPSVDTNELYGVTVVAANDVWAVGQYGAGGSWLPLAIHWNGSAWSQVVTPNPPGDHDYLVAVDAVSASDVWAVGGSQFGSSLATLTMHWNGSVWSVVPSPDPGVGGSHFVYGVAAVSAGDVWAVGESLYVGVGQTLILHWNGSSWAVVLGPKPGMRSHLYGVGASSATDVWAVGSYQNMTGTVTLTEHWDGTAWNEVPSPNTGTGADELYGVTAVSGSAAWAVGTQDGYGLIERWDGSVWSIVTAPEPGGSNYLQAVVAVSASDVWAVGDYFAGVQQTFIERYNPCAATPTPPPTQTVGGSTATPVPTNTRPPTQTPGGATATPEPTHCAIEFSDVAPGSTFYEYVRCMACRGIISGYASGCGSGDPCFRPNNNVTRGQLAKIVSNAAGFSDPPLNQSFEDVAPGSTFYDFVWRLYDRGIIGGYPCGGAGEPCVPPENRPYFRPNNNATRGQISKIVSAAANLPMPPPEQTFEDVAEGSTFWEYIEALAHTGAINGYPCGGVGEPCVPPENRPYFRPNSNATRGQTSKIVANTFFPGCNTPYAPAGKR